MIKVFVLPHIAALAAKIDAALDSGNLGVSSVEEIAAKNIRSPPWAYSPDPWPNSCLP